jgi:NAD(P)-dependent dehydrogenase (short-subunit alcohol dehydrogenase family)
MNKTRRQLLTVGVAGIAGAAITQQVQANTQKPPSPATQTNSNGRFAGGVDTPMLRKVREQRGMSFEEGSKAIPIGRTNTVEEMARAVMFLASDDATAFHGSLVDVTSGMLD